MYSYIVCNSNLLIHRESNYVVFRARRKLLDSRSRQLGAQAGKKLFGITEDATQLRGDSVDEFVMERLVAVGENMGLTGADLLQFVTDQQTIEREERQKERELEREEQEAAERAGREKTEEAVRARKEKGRTRRERNDCSRERTTICLRDKKIRTRRGEN